MTSVVCVQGDHKGDEVDSRLLFRLGYCLPDCALKSSQGKQDEQQQLNKVSQVRKFSFEISLLRIFTLCNADFPYSHHCRLDLDPVMRKENLITKHIPCLFDTD